MARGRTLADAVVVIEPDMDTMEPTLRRKSDEIVDRVGDREGRRFSTRISEGLGKGGSAISGALSKVFGTSGPVMGSKFASGFTTRIAATLPGGISTAVTAGGPYVAIAAVALAATLVAVLAPAIGAGIVAGVLLAVGGGVIAAGIMAAANSPGVKKAFASFGDRAKKAFADFGKPFEGPLIRAANTFATALERMAPTFKRMGAFMAPLIDKLAPAFAQMAEKSLPGIERAVKASAPLFEMLAEQAPIFGEAISKFFDSVAKGAPGATIFLRDLFTLLGATLVATGKLFSWLANEYTTTRDRIIRVSAAVVLAWQAVGNFFGTTLPNLFKKGTNAVVAEFNRERATAKAVVDAILGFFKGLGRSITVDVPNQFRAGVTAIGKWWDSLKAKAAAPVKFVIETVINRGIIDTFNSASGFFGGPKMPHVPTPKGMGDGPGHKGEGDGFGFGDLASFLGGPAKWLRNKVSGGIDAIGSRFGNSPMTSMLKGVPGKLIGSAASKLLALFGISEISGVGAAIGRAVAGSGGLQPGIAGVLGSLRSTFGSVPLISGFRAGSRTLTGNVSYHASGRAVDIPPVQAWAAYLKAVWGNKLRELITPWQQYNVHNGQPHTYTGAVWNQHNFAGGNAHIHAALDDGGRRTLRPGLNVIPNGLGRNESIYGPAEISEVVALLAQILEALYRLAPDVAAAFSGGLRGASRLAKART